MTKPLVFDLFCGAGGAATGWHRAGYRVMGVDTTPNLNYPFPRVIRDAVTVAIPPGVDVIHASPPCQAYTTLSNWNASHNNGQWINTNPLLIAVIRERLEEIGKPYVIENVCGAKQHLKAPIRLHGGMFGLRVYRPRLFECSLPVAQPRTSPVPINPVAIYGKCDGRRLGLDKRKDGTYLHVASLQEARDAMGMHWATWDEIREAVPPAYTEYIGRQLLPLL